MEQETTQQEEARVEKHYGKEIAVGIVGVLAVVGIIYGAFYGGGAGKATYTAPQKEAPVTAVTTPIIPEPTDVFVMTDMNKTRKGGQVPFSLKN